MRALLRDRGARDREGLYVAEGPRLLAAALDAGAPVAACYVGSEASATVDALARRAARSGVPVHRLAPGVTARVADTVTSQHVLALVRLVRHDPGVLADADLAVIGAPIADPGNAGTVVRSLAAAGGTVFGLGPGSVDAYNPKVVRASAGACFWTRIVEGWPAMDMLEVLGAHGVRRIGAAVEGGARPEDLDLARPCAFVLGHETRGLPAGLPLDDLVTIPMRPVPGDTSLNVAMAGTVLVFEAARQRRRT